MGAVVGIDLGTTYCAVAHVNAMGKPEIIPNREGERITPSVVLFQGDSPLVGSMAKRSAPTCPADCAQFVKRQMGDAAWRFITSGNESFTAEQVSAIILKRLAEDAAMYLGEPVTDAVITVPAYFDDARRRATIDAGQIAGLNVRRVLNEPTAAALSYGLDTQESGTFLVYDLGGGTFDVTVMHVADGTFDVLATDGDRNLGGFDWDNVLISMINDKAMAEGSRNLLDDDSLTAELRDKAELAKRTLSTMEQTKVFLTVDGNSYQIPVSRSEFQQSTADLLARTDTLLQMVMESAGLTMDQIDQVLLVGGSTRMPAVQELVRRVTGKEPDRSINPDEAVALGAAVQAHILAADDSPGLLPALHGASSGTPTILDVTSQSLGVVALNEFQVEANAIIINRDTKVPCKRSSMFSTVADNQTELRVRVTEGDDEDLEYVNFIGESLLTIPPYPRGAPVEVILSYDIDGMIHVEVIDGTSGQPLGEFEIDRVANLSPEQREQMRAHMQSVSVN
jgi:molecular chaperone DnaK